MSSGCQRAFYTLYRELGKIGVTAQAVKHCLVWEVAAMLGVGTEADDASQTTTRASASAADIMRQRIAASQGLAPEPEAATPTQAEIEEMQAAFALPSM